MFLNPIQQGRDANNNPVTPLTDKRFNQPFHVYDVSYDSGADQLDFNVGVGRAVFDGNLVEQTSETTFSYSNPSASTTYHIYLNSDGSFRLEQTANPNSIEGSTLLSRLDTPSDLNNTGADDLTDLRNMLPGRSGMASKITRKEIFTSDGTFTVPSGVSTVLVSMVAGGGGGAGSTNEGPGGGGGAGQSLINKSMSVTGGNSINLTVGAGGGGGSLGNPGSNGSDTTFNNTTVTGGGGGDLDTLGDVAIPGLAGQSYAKSGASSHGAAVFNNLRSEGGSSPFGAGGETSNNGNGFGSGGGGGGNGAGESGGDGADGIVIVQW